MKNGVCKIRNTVSGKHYIGSAVNLCDCERQHFQRLETGVRGNEPLQQTYKKSPRRQLCQM